MVEADAVQVLGRLPYRTYQCFLIGLLSDSPNTTNVVEPLALLQL